VAASKSASVVREPQIVKVALSELKIPLNLPLQRETLYSPLFSAGERGMIGQRQFGIRFSKVKLTLTLSWVKLFV
jgi:hypothetical protein